MQNTQNGRPRGLDFGAALRAKEETATVRIGGVDRSIRRARLGLHLELLEIAAGDVVDRVLPYVALASGVPEDDIELEECAAAFTTLVYLNAPQGLSALQRYAGPGPPIPPALSYPGRGLAALIHELAYAYGWTVDYILQELSPEEAWCYLQEIHVDRHSEREWLYTMSDVGRDKKGRQKPMQDPHWLRIGYDDVSRRRAPLPQGLRPSGTVIDLNELVKQRRRDGSEPLPDKRRPGRADGRGIGAHT